MSDESNDCSVEDCENAWSGDFYIGVKIVEATPADDPKAGPDRESQGPGYRVRYKSGYESWCPKRTFEDANRRIDTGCMSFGMAIEAMKDYRKVARQGWNGKGMWLMIIPVGNAACEGFPMQNCIGMKTVQDVMQPGWLASQADMLADDWFIVD